MNPSEFGGVDGLVQPLPHEMTPAERLRAMHRGEVVESELVVPPIHGGGQDE